MTRVEIKGLSAPCRVQRPAYAYHKDQFSCEL